MVSTILVWVSVRLLATDPDSLFRIVKRKINFNQLLKYCLVLVLFFLEGKPYIPHTQVPDQYLKRACIYMMKKIWVIVIVFNFEDTKYR